MPAPPFGGTWSLANIYGIGGTDTGSDHLVGPWIAGHVNDAIVVRGQGADALLVATDRAGVWWVQQPGSGGVPGATPMSNAWDNTLAMCLAQGPHGGTHFYAGNQGPPDYTGIEGTLRETEDDFQTSRDISPPGAGTIYKSVVTSADPRRVVVASSGGVYWSIIPSAGGSYNWIKVTQQSVGSVTNDFPVGAYSGLALASNDTVIAAAYGVDSLSTTGLHGLFHGGWQLHPLTRQPVLTLAAVPASNMPPVPPQSFTTFAQQMGRTSLASCSNQPNNIYAVSATVDATVIYAVLKSDDSGAIWTLALGTQALSGQAAWQGGYNNCIAVAPTDPARFLIGWDHGVFQSRDSGTSFTQYSHLNRPGLHDDVHGLYFDPADSSNNTFYVCSDGGVAKTQDGGATFDTSFNRYLANLECYSDFARDFSGSLSVRGDFMATGLQDNANVYCALNPASGVNSWVDLGQGGDGGWVALLATGQLIAANKGGTGEFFIPRKDAPHSFLKGGAIPVRDMHGDDVHGLNGAFAIEPVLNPTFQNLTGQNIYAVARGQRTTELGPNLGLLNVYGAFANADGSDLHWEQLGSCTSNISGDAVNALATLDDGSSVLVGMNSGFIFLLTPVAGGLVAGRKLSISLPQAMQGGIYRIVFVSTTLAFAIFDGGDAGHILRFDGAAWSLRDTGLPGSTLFGLSRDSYGRTYTCTDDKVWVSLNDGESWADASMGLPRRSHCADIRFDFTQPNPQLYLSTFGHSVWAADVTPPAINLTLTISPSSVIGGRQNATATITLLNYSSSSTAFVNLLSLNTNLAAVPNPVPILAGQNQAQVQVTTLPSPFATPAFATIEAVFSQGQTAFANLEILPQPAAPGALSSISLDQEVIGYDESAECTITIATPTTPEVVNVTLDYQFSPAGLSDFFRTLFEALPQSLTITSASSTSASFEITTKSVPLPPPPPPPQFAHFNMVIIAAAGGVSKRAQLTVFAKTPRG
jgi:hypothetical protein